PVDVFGKADSRTSIDSGIMYFVTCSAECCWSSTPVKLTPAWSITNALMRLPISSSGTAEQGSFNFTQLDTVSAALNLIIAASEKVVVAVFVRHDQIACAVHLLF